MNVLNILFSDNTHYAPKRLGLLFGCVGLLFCSGCGPNYDGPRRAAVNGQVSLNGKPISKGSIEFIPTDGTAGPTAGARIVDGKYEVNEAKGPVIGTYQVRIFAPGPTGRKVSVGSLGPPGTVIDEIGETVPSNYNAKSTLEREINAGKNQLDFDLAAPGT